MSVSQFIALIRHSTAFVDIIKIATRCPHPLLPFFIFLRNTFIYLVCKYRCFLGCRYRFSNFLYVFMFMLAYFATLLLVRS